LSDNTLLASSRNLIKRHGAIFRELEMKNFKEAPFTPLATETIIEDEGGGFVAIPHPPGSSIGTYPTWARAVEALRQYGVSLASDEGVQS
jgi:hypothetical protein